MRWRIIFPYYSLNFGLLLLSTGIWFGTNLKLRNIAPFWAIQIATFTILALGIIKVLSRPNQAKVLTLAWCFILLLCGLSLTTQYRFEHSISYPKQSLAFTAIIVEPPDLRLTKQYLTLKPTHPLGHDPTGTETTGLILTKAPRFPAFSMDQVLEVQGSIQAPEPVQDFDYPLYLLKSGISGIMNKPALKPALQTNQPSLLSYFYTLRTKLEFQAKIYLPEPEAAFLNGILLGSKRAIPEDVQADLKATGTTHIVAISGANITIMLGLLAGILPLYSLLSQFQATILAAGFITVLTGGSASVIRGALVAIVGKYLRFKGRRIYPLGLFLLCFNLILIYNPLMLKADPGFQLSFAAYFGLMYFSKPLEYIFQKLSFLKLPLPIQSASIETTAATLGTAPVSLLNFGQVAPLGLLVNPLILWLLPLTTLLGFCLIALGLSPLNLGYLNLIVSLPLWLCLHSILSVISFFAA